MMMPANYSAVAENELTYVVGGGLVDTLVPVMNDGNWQQLNKNLITIVGNSVLSKTIDASLAKIFGGEYVPGGVIGSAFKYVSKVWDANYDETIGGAAKGVFNVAL